MKGKFEKIVEASKRFTPEEKEKILLAMQVADSLHKDQKRANGEPYIIHPIVVAEILMEWEMDVDTVCAGLLHDTIEDTDISYSDINAQFGKTVADLVEGVTKITAIKTDKALQEAETIRKIFFAMSKDIRVIIIKLADKLHNMRTLQYLKPERQKIFANETLDIYAPLADRLGMSKVKAELEDLSLKTLKPDTYFYIQDYLLSKKGEQTAFLNRVEKALYQACAKENLGNILISSRAKHTYSVYLKMKKRKKDIEEIYDILGVRILCDTESECYTILGVVHKLWPPIEGRFKDYIAMPKANNYQSLHTTVMAIDGKLLEIQIRTKKMHWTAENGVAAHWQYKMDSGSESKVAMDNAQFSKIIGKLKTWSSEIEHSESYMEDIKQELLKDTIYVFTPQGHIVELPANSTALDFAYQIHSEVGNHTTGAKADGSIIPLNQPLKNTQVIEILTNPNARPHLSWLRYAQSNSARKKIRAWLNKYDETLLIDKNIIAKKSQVEEKVKNIPPTPQGSNQPLLPCDEIIRHVQDQSRQAFRVGDEKNMMISLAQCCCPQHGDEIVGYVSRGRGIIVHKADCPNLANMPEFEERKIDVIWETESPRITRKFRVTSKRTYDLFSEIEGSIKKYKGHLIEGRLIDGDDGSLIGTFTMECDHEDDFKKAMKAIKTLPPINTISTIS